MIRFDSSKGMPRILAGAVIVAGIILRCWHWSSQLFLDDEWHALNFVLNRSFIDVFMQQGLGANSIPVNVYTWMVLHTTGWSEVMLRLPSMAAGISALIVIPLLVRRIWGDSVACVTAALLAVSPVVIFYCRITRPYAPAMLLAATSVLLTLIWMKEGRRRFILLSALSGSLAIYYHLYTVIPVGIPLLVALTAAWKPLGRRLGLILDSKSPFVDLLSAGGIMAVTDGVLVVIPNVINPWWSHGIHGVDRADLQTAVTVLSLISGTRNPVLMGIVLILFMAGLVLMVKRARIMGAAIALSFFVFSAVMAMTTQDGAHTGIQVARYGITFVPLSFVAIAVALVRTGESLRTKFALLQRRHLLIAVGLLAWLPFLVTSPLWTTYAYPNNFTNHSAYQYRYDPIQWQQRSPERDLSPGVSLEYGSIPRLYFQPEMLASAKGIIEYPLLIGDHFNIYYYYQHFHRLPVVAGFASNNMFAPVGAGGDFVIGSWPIDSVMTGIPELLGKRSAWRSMVDLNDVTALRSRFKGWVVIIHRDLLAELHQPESIDEQMSLELAKEMNESFGKPRFADDQLAAWMIE